MHEKISKKVCMHQDTPMHPCRWLVDSLYFSQFDGFASYKEGAMLKPTKMDNSGNLNNGANADGFSDMPLKGHAS